MRHSGHGSAPPPDLRIVPTNMLLPHEEHDSQRSIPLVGRMRSESVVINPPIVAPIDAEHYVILDGANRVYAFAELEYPHILVQVAPYESGIVELETWRHIVAGWTMKEFIQHLRELPEVALEDGQDAHAIAHILTPDGEIIALRSPIESTHERNAALRKVVSIYQRSAILHRTAIAEPADIWPLHPDGIALVHFPHYAPADIITAARQRAFLPPGISRHIVHGRAVRVNYPLDALRDPTTSLEAKNETLQIWIQRKLANRQVRYYAEATYQFDE